MCPQPIDRRRSSRDAADCELIRQTLSSFELDNRLRASRDEMRNEQHHADQEQHPSNLRGNGGNAIDAERSCNQAENQEHKRVIQHGRLLVRDQGSVSTITLKATTYHIATSRFG